MEKSRWAMPMHGLLTQLKVSCIELFETGCRHISQSTKSSKVGSTRQSFINGGVGGRASTAVIRQIGKAFVSAVTSKCYECR